MGSIFVSGTKRAALTAGLATLLTGAPEAGAMQAGSLGISFEGLRNARGLVRICVTRNPRHFPRCQNDPDARRLNVPAGANGPVRIDGLAPGSYAISLFHDENRNGQLDTFLGIPREGFGFSRNPRIGFGPPRFDQVRFEVRPGDGAQRVRLRYIV
jgi:uncharacterized protein (DUF2141 family)